jgi:hypothetical protein
MYKKNKFNPYPKSNVMKKMFVPSLSIFMVILCLSCDLLKSDDTAKLNGDQSPMGAVGVSVSSSSATLAGVSNFSASVTASEGGISTYSGQATVDNTLLKNLVSNIPGVTVNGNLVSTNNMQFKSTTDGLELMTGPGAGVLVNYNSSVGDTYPIGTTGSVREVVSKTGVDDYSYGFYLIKVVKVEETPSYLKSTSAGITKITYIANHKFGLVGVMFTLDDGTSVTFPIYTSTEN